MAHEVSQLFRTEPSIPYTVADGTGIEKGTVCALSDPATAAAATGDGDVIAGILEEEKLASDGRTIHGLFRRGIFRMKCSGAVPVGAGLISAGYNKVQAVVNADGASGAAFIGIAEETGADDEWIRVAFDVGSGGGYEKA